ncbi:MAG TPA: orotidine-5'-phosphate decarboxylase [Terriglobales bacterium]|nr:orotidine-5'-phosphate decarboxylase [Terriglobales bacterium]
MSPLSSSELQRARARLIFALHHDSLDEAMATVHQLRDEVGMFKVGKQLFLHAGPKIIQLIREAGAEIFLDLKFHDIPATVANASVEATRLGVLLFNLHASGSLEMMRRTVAAVNRVCRTENLRHPKLLAVTVLTSLSQEDLGRVGVAGEVEDQVVRLARLAQEAGMDGVVASALEIAPIRAACGEGFLIVTPGIRPEASAWDDQKRVLTPEEAIRTGADYLVVGRPIQEAADPVAAARTIVAEIARGLASR